MKDVTHGNRKTVSPTSCLISCVDIKETNEVIA